MRIEHGPPPQAGVQNLQYLSSYDGIDGVLDPGGIGGMVRLGGIGLAAYGWAKKDQGLTRMGIAAAVISLLL